MQVTYADSNLADHKVSRDEVDDVVSSETSMEFDLPPSKRGNERIMIVGFSATGRLLEVGIEFFHFEERMHIFHAQKANQIYKKIFEKRIKQ